MNCADRILPLRKAFSRSLCHSLLLLSALFFTSCASKLFTGISSDYPDSWPHEFRTEDPESAMAGTYENFGRYTYNPNATPQFDHAALGSVLGDFPASDQSEPGVIAITHARAGVLQVELIIDGVSHGSRFLESARGDFKIADGTVWLSKKKTQYGDGTGYVWASDSIGLRKARDGSLICEWRHGSAALAMWIVPLKGSQVFWMRWSPETKLSR